MNSPGKNTGVGCHSLLQGIFLTQGSNLGFLELQAGSLPTELPGKPRMEREEILNAGPWDREQVKKKNKQINHKQYSTILKIILTDG